MDSSPKAPCSFMEDTSALRGVPYRDFGVSVVMSRASTYPTSNFSSKSRVHPGMALHPCVTRKLCCSIAYHADVVWQVWQGFEFDAVPKH